jgi:hypothetical protein
MAASFALYEALSDMVLMMQQIVQDQPRCPQRRRFERRRRRTALTVDTNWTSTLRAPGRTHKVHLTGCVGVAVAPVTSLP